MNFAKPQLRGILADACLRRPKVRVSGGDLCEAEAPTDAAAETSAFGNRKPFEKGLTKTLCCALSNLKLITLVPGRQHCQISVNLSLNEVPYALRFLKR